jgi:hypothetical protein
MTHKNLPIYIGSSKGFAETITIDNSIGIVPARRLTKPYVFNSLVNLADAYPQSADKPKTTKIKIQGFGDNTLLNNLESTSQNTQQTLYIGDQSYTVYIDSYSFSADPNNTIKININATRLDTSVMTIPASGGTPYTDFEFVRGYLTNIVDASGELNNITELSFSQTNRWTYVYNTDGSAGALINGSTKEITYTSTGLSSADFRDYAGAVNDITLEIGPDPIDFSTTNNGNVTQESWAVNDVISVQTTITEQIY